MTKEELNNKLDEFIDSLDFDEKADRTLKSYRNAVNKFIAFCPEEEFEIKKSFVINWKKSLYEKYF